jgi:hypothetical protein
MKYGTSILSAFAAFTLLAGIQARADNMASIAITPATGVVTLVPRWSIGGNLAGFHQKSQNLPFTGSVANDFYSITNAVIPAGGNILAFKFYVAASGSATPHSDTGSKLTPDSYSGLTSADPDVGYGAVNLYLIHHKGTTDYFTAIIPGSATATAVTDEKPMSGPGGPATVTGVSGYFGLTFAAANLGYGLNNFYYLRTDSVTGFTKFGTLAPALLGSSADQFDLGMGGHNAVTFTGTDVGYGTDQMYYLRLDPITGYTIFGTLNPALAGARHTSDIANLGSVYTTLAFVPGDLGFGSGRFYTTGAVNPTWQSVSFAAIADRGIGAGSFTVTPSASSGLPITLTVVTGSASISGPVAGVFTVTPTAPGLITLQAAQAGQPGVAEFNMLRQSFTASTGVRSTGDFNGDGKSDLLWQNSRTGERTLWLMNGTTLLGVSTLGIFPLEWTVAATGDFNGDGKPDIIWSNSITGERALWLMNGTMFLGSSTLGFFPLEWTIAGTGDFNGDGKPDIVWSNSITGERAIWLMNGTQFLGSSTLGFFPLEWTIAGTGDFNGDGKPDIVWSNSITGERAIWLMNGTQFLGAATLGIFPLEWTVAGTGNFNGDGKTDIIWSNSITGERAIWLMNGTQFLGSSTLGIFPLEWTVKN